MEPNDQRNGSDREWDAISARLARGLGRRPFSLDEARAAFAAAPAVRLTEIELETIILAGAQFDAPRSSEANGSSVAARGRESRASSHPLRHEPLDRRDLPAPLTLLFCTADVLSISSERPQPIEVPARLSESAWISDLHEIDRAPWPGFEGWTAEGEVVGGDAQFDPPDWRDTLDIDPSLELAGLHTVGALAALAVTSTDVTHDVVFTDDGWREAS